MKTLKNKTKISTIALILTLTISAVLVALPITTALDLPVDIPTFLNVSAAPDPVGVNQIVWLHALFTKPLPNSNGLLGDRHENVTIEIVAPDGSKTVLGPFTAGMTGGVSTSWVPNQVGEYTLQAIYPGEILDLMNPYNRDPTTADRHVELLGSYSMPSVSPLVSLTVQQEPVESIYQTPPRPTEYWTRPIHATNWGWGELGANWFGLDSSGFTTTGKYDATGNVQPYGTAPNTPHIMWTKPTHFGGQPGAPIPADQSTQFTSTSVVINYFDGPIIMSGILFYTQYASWTGTVVSWEAVDLRTGETLWSRPAGITGNERLKCGQILRFHNAQEYGSLAYLWSGPTNGVFRIYDAYTGELQANVTDARNMAFLMDVDAEQMGTLLGYYTSDGNLVMWNSTKLIEYERRLQIRAKYNKRTYNFTDGISWSVPIPDELNGVPISLSIARRTPEVILLRESPTFAWQGTNFGYQITAGIDAKTGELLWGPINQTLPFLEATRVEAARDGYYILHNQDMDEVDCYSLINGQKLWGPVEIEANAWSSQYRGAEIAYGKVYIWDTGGNVNAINLETGEVEWTFTRGSAGYDSPFGVYPIFGYRVHSIADGKLFLSEGYMYSPPLHPARRIAIDCETGELVWSILSYSARAAGAIADGYLVEWNSYDNQIYSFGKGPTETTVTAPDVGIPIGSIALISGSVMDISSGAEQAGVIERFPNGLPAVADEDMREWMEYVYKQQSQPADVTGVPVKIETVDPNNNYHDYGTTTTDAYGNYALPFEPELEGTYLIMATFEGSESYWRSHSATYLTAAPAAAAETDLTSLEGSVSNVEDSIFNLTTYILAILALVVIAVVIAVYSILKSRQ